MFLTKLEVKNFRNYKQQQVKLCDKVNIFIGNNAQGKTNILESIYILALTKSHRIGLENNIIRNGSDFCRIKGILNDNQILKNLELEVYNDKKKVYLNQKEIKKISSYISNINIIMFCPTDLDIIKGSPQVRRNLLNIQLSQLYPLYIDYLNEYNKILKTRNEYLKQLNINGYTDMRYLNIINEKLVDRGVKIYLYRKKYLDLINSKINNIYNKLTKLNGLNIKYETSIDLNDIDEDKLKEKYLNKLENNLKREILQGMTLYGPHRDDFVFYLTDEDLKLYGSQGQQRLAIISFKLSEIDIFKNEKNTSPILLLDDIFSELDIDKRNELIKFLPIDIQIIITTTDLKNIKKKILNNAKVFNVENGTIKEKAG